ncbi:MAG: hypothetical protein A2464_09680 [Deltaproteobacteria bacterium RIFOXYC2_FULL_48_10]|nr:MAG: hypothetical protein A2464_09680 [Deltaproteobacteria bacterium RIFOXYC2_FULL_48_10]
MKKENMDFPLKTWEQMNEQEQNHFRKMSQEDIVGRWHSKQGEEIKRRIIEVNLRYGSSNEYRQFIGTVKISWGEKPPKIDLRGIDFSGFSNLTDDEIFGFDFSDCSLTYSNFSDAELSTSNFKGTDILYSNFSHSELDECDFSDANLTLSDFSSSSLEGSNFQNSWISDVSFRNANLGYIKYNRRTDFHNIDIASAKGSSNPIFVSYVKRKQYLKHFQSQSSGNKVLYYVWLSISDCGQSFTRWSLTSLVICIGFGFMYSTFPDSFIIANNRASTPFTFYYYSAVAFTTLGFGDIVPKALWAEVAVTAEVIIGYVMLGGLISIFATKFIPKD